MGRRSTPAAFIAACDKFIYLEVLGLADPAGSGSSGSSTMWPTRSCAGS